MRAGQRGGNALGSWRKLEHLYPPCLRQMHQPCRSSRASRHSPSHAGPQPTQLRGFSGSLPSLLETPSVLNRVRPPCLAARQSSDCPRAEEDQKVQGLTGPRLPKDKGTRQWKRVRDLFQMQRLRGQPALGFAHSPAHYVCHNLPGV